MNCHQEKKHKGFLFLIFVLIYMAIHFRDKEIECLYCIRLTFVIVVVVNVAVVFVVAVAFVHYCIIFSF